MKNLSKKISDPAALVCLCAAVLLCGGCTSASPEDMTVLAFVSSMDSAFDWGYGDLVLLYRQGNCWHLKSFFDRGSLWRRAVFDKKLGENIRLSERGLFFENGRIHIEYTDGNGRPRHASVPFGDFFGDTHISEMPAGSSRQPLSPLYGVAGITKKEEAAVESFLPTLQKHIRANDADGISRMICYPMEVYAHGKGFVQLENRYDFLKYYPQIFTEELKQDLLKLQSRDIFCNYKGLMINRRMWFFVAGDGKAYFSVL